MKLRNSDKDFELEINSLARDGWCVTSSVSDAGSGMFKVIMERDKNR